MSPWLSCTVTAAPPPGPPRSASKLVDSTPGIAPAASRQRCTNAPVLIGRRSGGVMYTRTSTSLPSMAA
ncbi:hypothetical protein KBTX_03916 [wastewater metagenome]|uniref:Uncharacterized protein n=2 Tax=unclassified sequences TaxID=12908 RepID=A0A5B8RI21_9ZZZZ|nr:hypothetical protein KBTEX_03916 [uncultured organism]